MDLRFAIKNKFLTRISLYGNVHTFRKMINSYNGCNSFLHFDSVVCTQF
jgi:hypothetical protein